MKDPLWKGFVLAGIALFVFSLFGFEAPRRWTAIELELLGGHPTGYHYSRSALFGLAAGASLIAAGFLFKRQR